MNRKGFVDIIFFVSVFILLIVIVIMGVYQANKLVDLKGEACVSLGYEEYHYKNGFRFCSDTNGNLYYVTYDIGYTGLKDFIVDHVNMSEISVGNVRVLQ